MTVNQNLVYSLEFSQRLLHLFTDDLSPQEMLHRVTPKANCAAWIIGHLILAERMTHKRVQADSPALPEGFEQRFARDEQAAGKSDFGDVSVLLPLFDAHRAATIAAVKTLPTERFDAPVDAAVPLFKTVGEAVSFVCMHQAMHAGQITVIRRSLGRTPVI